MQKEASERANEKTGKPRRRKRRWFWLGCAAAGLLGLYALAGFVGVPRLVMGWLLPSVKGQINGTLRLAEFHFNPFTFVIKVSGLELLDRAGAPVATVQQLTANLDPSAVLFSRTWQAHGVRIQQAMIAAELYQDGQLNLQGLFKEEAAAAPRAVPRVLIDGLRVVDADIVFRDYSAESAPIESRWMDLRFEIDQIDTRGEILNLHTLTARTPAGEEVHWEGNVQLDPLASRGTVTIREPDFQRIAPYLAEAANAEIEARDVRVTLRYEYDPSAAPPVTHISLEGASLSDLRVVQRERLLLATRKLDIHDLSVDSNARIVQIGQILLDSPHLNLMRSADGQFSGQNVVRAAEASASRAAGTDRSIPAALHAESPKDAAVGAIETVLARLIAALSDFGTSEDGAWQAAIQEIDAQRGSLEFREVDQSAAPLRLQEMHCRAGPLHTGARSETSFSARFEIEHCGEVHLEGALTPLDGAARLHLRSSEFDLLRIAEYMRPSGNDHESAVRGRLSIDGEATLRWSDENDVRAEWVGAVQLADAQLRKTNPATVAIYGAKNLELRGRASLRSNPKITATWDGVVSAAGLEVRQPEFVCTAESASVEGQLFVDGATTDPQVAWSGTLALRQLIQQTSTHDGPVHFQSTQTSLNGDLRVWTGDHPGIRWDGAGSLEEIRVLAPQIGAEGRVIANRLRLTGALQLPLHEHTTQRWNGSLFVSGLDITASTARREHSSAFHAAEVQWDGTVQNNQRQLTCAGSLSLHQASAAGPLAGDVESVLQHCAVHGELAIAPSQAGAPAVSVTASATIRNGHLDAARLNNLRIDAPELRLDQLRLGTAERSLGLASLTAVEPRVRVDARLIPPRGPAQSPGEMPAPLRAAEQLLTRSGATAGQVLHGALEAQRHVVHAGEQLSQAGQHTIRLGAGAVEAGVDAGQTVLRHGGRELQRAGSRITPPSPLLAPVTGLLDLGLSGIGHTMERGAEMIQTGREALSGARSMGEQGAQVITGAAKGAHRTAERALHVASSQSRQVASTVGQVGSSAFGAAGAFAHRAANLGGAMIEAGGKLVGIVAIPPAERIAAQTRASGPLLSLPYNLRVERVSITQGALDLRDNAADPSLAIALQDLDAQLTSITSDGRAPVHLDVQSQLTDGGLVGASGSVNPFSSRPAVDVRIQAERVPLQQLEAYVIRYLGHRVQSGHLSADVPVQIQNDYVQGSADLLLENFRVGQKVEPGAAPDVNIPLALDVLHDRSGQIHTRIGFEGDLKDPQFNMSDVIGQAFAGLLMKVALSPIDVVATSVGAIIPTNQESLSTIRFDPGAADVSPEMIDRLRSIATLLHRKPNMRVALRGHYSRRDLLHSSFAHKTSTSGGEGFAPPPMARSPGRQIAEAGDMEDGAELALRRAQAVQQILTRKFGVPPDRVSIASQNAQHPADTPGVSVELAHY